MFDINGGEALVLLVIAVLVVGPERLPRYAEQLGQLVRRARDFLRDTKTRVDDELGDEVKDVDWAALDPRRYDPRRIVREALLDDLVPPGRPSAGATPGSTAAAAAAAEARRARRAAARAGVPAEPAASSSGAAASVAAASGTGVSAADVPGAGDSGAERPDTGPADVLVPFDDDAT